MFLIPVIDYIWPVESWNEFLLIQEFIHQWAKATNQQDTPIVSCHCTSATISACPNSDGFTYTWNIERLYRRLNVHDPWVWWLDDKKWKRWAPESSKFNLNASLLLKFSLFALSFANLYTRTKTVWIISTNFKRTPEYFSFCRFVIPVYCFQAIVFFSLDSLVQQIC